MTCSATSLSNRGESHASDCAQGICTPIWAEKLMNIQQAIAQVVDGQSLSRAEMEQVMLAVMQGEATEASCT